MDRFVGVSMGSWVIFFVPVFFSRYLYTSAGIVRVMIPLPGINRPYTNERMVASTGRP